MTDTPRLGLYIHWPYCAHICPYCDFNVYRPKGDTDALLTAIMKDMTAWRERTGARRLSSVHFGGGTPSLLEPGQLSALIDHAAGLWGLASNAEIGLEANPNDAARFTDFRAAGLNRLSLGIQSFDDDVLKRLGRDHNARGAIDAIRLAQQVFDEISIDLIYAWAGQSLDHWHEELKTAIATGAGHLSPYQLTIEPRTAFGKRAERGERLALEPDDAADFYALTETVCAEAGFAPYEISNLARSTHAQSRHNRLYWDGDDWIGVGPGAHGRLGSHSGAGRYATEAQRRPSDYIKAIETAGDGVIAWARLSAADELAERILMGMRVQTGLDRERLIALTGFDIDLEGAQKMSELGLVEREGHHIRLTREGRALADGVSSELVPALDD
ncbi:MAG: radical SAM family heme chaperone HemW [Alphaproteobacteria bacterium]|nr:radical SAM family heme chaperone HemW [Alphaproteobacteria bacterium]